MSAARASGTPRALTRRLLASARRQRLEPKPVDGDRLVSRQADLVRRTAGPGIAVELRPHGGTGSVLCDPNEFESALLNLCINARDARPEGGRLVIGTREADLPAQDARDARDGDARPGRYAAVSVADSGTGMPPEVLDRAFEPFFTTKPHDQAAGPGHAARPQPGPGFRAAAGRPGADRERAGARHHGQPPAAAARAPTVQGRVCVPRPARLGSAETTPVFMRQK